LNAWSGTTKTYAPAVTLTASATAIIPSQSVTFTVTANGSGATPTGTVQFLSNGSNLGSPVTLTGGSATTPASTFPLGTYNITAHYSGDSNYSAETSNAVTVVVTAKATPTVALSASANYITTAQSVSFSVSASGYGGTPTGTVQFLSNGSNLGSPVTLSGGAANSPAETFSTAGIYAITAQYSGDANFNATTSNTLTLTVNSVQQTSPSFTLSAPPLTISAPGATTGNSETITLTGQNGFSGTVALTCTVAYTGSGTPNDPPTCSLANNGSATIASGSTSATIVAVFNTTAAVARNAPNPSMPWSRGSGVFFACLILLPLGALRKSPLRKSWQRSALWSFLVLAGVSFAVAGCGSSGNTPIGNPGTTPGTYQVSLNGTSGSLTAQTTFTLTVQ
jgi:hypothetical protein